MNWKTNEEAGEDFSTLGRGSSGSVPRNNVRRKIDDDFYSRSHGSSGIFPGGMRTERPMRFFQLRRSSCSQITFKRRVRFGTLVSQLGRVNDLSADILGGERLRWTTHQLTGYHSSVRQIRKTTASNGYVL